MSKLIDIKKVLKKVEKLETTNGKIIIKLDLDYSKTRNRVGSNDTFYYGYVGFYDSDNNLITSMTSGKYKGQSGAQYSMDKLEKQLLENGFTRASVNNFHK